MYVVSIASFSYARSYVRCHYFIRFVSFALIAHSLYIYAYAIFGCGCCRCCRISIYPTVRPKTRPMCVSFFFLSRYFVSIICHIDRLCFARTCYCLCQQISMHALQSCYYIDEIMLNVYIATKEFLAMFILFDL